MKPGLFSFPNLEVDEVMTLHAASMVVHLLLWEELAKTAEKIPEDGSVELERLAKLQGLHHSLLAILADNPREGRA